MSIKINNHLTTINYWTSLTTFAIIIQVTMMRLGVWRKPIGRTKLTELIRIDTLWLVHFQPTLQFTSKILVFDFWILKTKLDCHFLFLIKKGYFTYIVFFFLSILRKKHTFIYQTIAYFLFCIYSLRHFF